MEKKFILVFDGVMKAQLKGLGKEESTRKILSKMFDKMESLGPRAGELIDSHIFLYEIKSKSPPLRLYYMHVKKTDELYVFEYEMKTSKKKQQKTIIKLKKKSKQIRNQDLF